VVGVRHDLMRAADKPLHAVLQVIEAHGVMTRIAAGRLQPHPGGENIPDLQQAQPIKADQRYFLSKLIDGDTTDSEDTCASGPTRCRPTRFEQASWAARVMVERRLGVRC
jgi:hypothetical protein